MHGATVGHVTRLKHPARKQNGKLQALISVAILQCLRKANWP